jgi:Fic family protein
MVKAIDQVASNEAAVAAMVQEVVSNSAIEGVALNMESVRASMLLRLGVETGLAQAVGVQRVDPIVGVLAEAAQGYRDPLTVERIFEWHRAIFPKGIQEGLRVFPAGVLRGEEPMVVLSPGRHIGLPPTIHFEAPGREVLEGEVEAFLAWFNGSPAGLDGLLRAALAHLWFITVHPLADGNGRIARTITDLALSQDEQLPLRYYSLSVQIMRNKQDYYDALESAQRGGLDITDWLAWFLSQVMQATQHGVREVAMVMARSRFWAMARKFSLNPRQEMVLKAILSPMSREDAVSNAYYCKLADTNRTTASRDLAELVGLDLLRPYGAGRSASYRIDLSRFTPGWLQPPL